MHTYALIGSSDGLMEIRKQVTTWTSDDRYQSFYMM